MALRFKSALTLGLLVVALLLAAPAAHAVQWVDPVCGKRSCPVHLGAENLQGSLTFPTIALHDGAPIVAIGQAVDGEDRVVVRKLEQGRWVTTDHTRAVPEGDRAQSLKLSNYRGSTYLTRSFSKENVGGGRGGRVDVQKLEGGGMLRQVVWQEGRGVKYAWPAATGVDDKIYLGYVSGSGNQPGKIYAQIWENGRRQVLFWFWPPGIPRESPVHQQDLATHSGRAYSAWTVEDPGGVRQLWLRYLTFGVNAELIPTSGPLNIAGEQNAYLPDLASIGGKLYVAWLEGGRGDRRSNRRVYVKRYENGRWAEPERAPLNVDPSKDVFAGLSIASVDNQPYAAFSEKDANGVDQVRVKRLVRDGDEEHWQRVGPSLNANSNKSAYLPQIIGVDGTPYVIWVEGSALGAKRVLVKALDTESDGHADNLDNCPRDANPNQGDMDGDGKGDVCDVDIDDDGVANVVDNCPKLANADQNNANASGRGDACEDDRDNDGVPDRLDAFPEDPLEYSDGDGDRVGDFRDNCPGVANSSQADGNGNGIGNACEAAPAPAPASTTPGKDVLSPKLKVRFSPKGKRVTRRGRRLSKRGTKLTLRSRRLVIKGQVSDEGGSGVAKVQLRTGRVCKTKKSRKSKRSKRTRCRLKTRKLRIDGKGRFKKTLSLKRGSHRLRIEAVDSAGNKVKRSYTIKRVKSRVARS